MPSTSTLTAPAPEALTVTGEQLRGVLTLWGGRLYLNPETLATTARSSHGLASSTEVDVQDQAAVRSLLRETGADLRFGVERVHPDDLDYAAAVLTVQLRAGWSA